MRTEITPTMAKKILETNTVNRKPSLANKAFLVEEILQGRFVYNGESVIISECNLLLDGQHRLLACVEANTPIEVNLVDGVPLGAMPTINTGRVRNAVDVLGMSNVNNKKSIGTLVKRILEKFGLDNKRSYTSTSAKKARRVKVSNGEILEFYKGHREVLDTVMDFSTHLYNTGTKIISASNVGAYIYLFSLEEFVDSQKAMNFFREVMLGIVINKNSNAGFKLRNKLIDSKIAGMKLTDKAQREYVMKAWKLYKTDKVVPTFGIKETDIFTFSKIDVLEVVPALDLEFMKKFFYHDVRTTGEKGTRVDSSISKLDTAS